MLGGEIPGARVEGPDQAAHAFRRTAAIGSREHEVLAERRADDLGALTLHLPRRGAERAVELG